MSQELAAKPTGITATANRYAWLVKLVSLAAIIVALTVAARSVSIDDLKQWVADLGVWGPVGFGAAYAVATVLMIPGSLMTLAAGPLFGLGRGFLTVSIASTTGAALAFLVARYFARSKIEQQAKRYPKFRAIDGAIGQRGWKIIALLRLSPAVPFALSNYFFGLTRIPFGHYVLTSWIAMMPGTIMYVYLGYAGGAAAGAAAGVSEGRSLGEWILLGVGLAATVLVTVYVTRIARKAIREQTDIEETAGDMKDVAANMDYTAEIKETEQRWPWGATVMLLLAAVAVTGAAYRGAIGNLFGPPSVTLREAYEQKAGGTAFDHSLLDRLLRKHVDADGWVDYAGLAGDSDRLGGYIEVLGDAALDKMGRNEKLALLINAYNAFTLRLILDHWDDGKLVSINDIPDAKRWKHRRWNVGGHTWSLNDIEHKQIRPKFKEARIHFALVCAAVGCPKLRNEAYAADRLDAQLRDQTEYTHRHKRWFRFDAKRGEVYLTKLYDWYGGDFKQISGSVLGFAAEYSAELAEALESRRKPKIRWLKYDWKLNDKRNKP